jgi:hypothetical protein
MKSDAKCSFMIAFCTHCWAEIDATATRCAHCHADLASDSRTYWEKLLAALMHPLPEVRERICWLLGENRIMEAIPHLRGIAENDSDLFVRRAARAAVTSLQGNQTPQ